MRFEIAASGWAVVVSAAFNLAIWLAPPFGGWRAVLFPIALLALLYSVLGFLCSHVDALRRFRGSQRAREPVVSVGVFIVCGLVGLMVWTISSRAVESPSPTTPPNEVPAIKAKARTLEDTIRHVSEIQLQAGREALRSYHPRLVAIAAADVFEARSYAREIASVFEAAAWTPVLFCANLPVGDKTGIWIFKQPQLNMPDTSPLREALNAMFLKFGEELVPPAQDYPIYGVPCELRGHPDGNMGNTLNGTEVSTATPMLYIGPAE